MTLPVELKPGLALVTASGQRVTVARVKERYEDAEYLYWLRYESGIVGHRAWVRDELVSEGVKIVEKRC